VPSGARAWSLQAQQRRTRVRIVHDTNVALSELEDKTEALAMNHDTFSHNTRAQLKKVFDALRELMTPPDPPKRPIGFISPEDKGSKKASRARLKT
jgi:hypothetical protein